MQSLAQIVLDKLLGSGYAVEVSVQVVAIQGSGHLLLANLSIKHPLAEMLALFITLLIDIHLVDDTAIRQDVSGLVFLCGNLLHQLGRVVVLHQLLNGKFFLAICSNVLWSHLLRMKFLAVNLGREEPVFKGFVRLVGMGMRHLATIDCHHLRVTVLLLALILLLCFLCCLTDSLFSRILFLLLGFGRRNLL